MWYGVPVLGDLRELNREMDTKLETEINNTSVLATNISNISTLDTKSIKLDTRNPTESAAAQK